MHFTIKKITSLPAKGDCVYLLKDLKSLELIKLSKEELNFISLEKVKLEKNLITINRYTKVLFFNFLKENKEGQSLQTSNYKLLEECRKQGDKLQQILNEHKIRQVVISNIDFNKEKILAFAEGMGLGNYQFIKYKKQDDKNGFNTLKEILIHSKETDETSIKELNILISAVYKCRDMVNEPVSFLTAVKLSELIAEMGKEAGFKTEILNKKKIESLKMGGLLSVNKGSVDPPTFTIMEWKPSNAKNKKPIVFVGKGVVFDTGGVNIKTGNHMIDMKCDMSGGAATACAMYAIAKSKLPVYLIGLVPASDNRPGGNAYVPGDVVTMYDGITVEVLNTDAEGRMLLGDALSYAKKYKPELVIDLATLTGAASAAVGRHGIVAMGTDSEEDLDKLEESGKEVYERLAKFPFWEEYGEMIKSEVAEIKNTGGANSGAITAGKFLARFTDYPWIHLDIAGPAFVDTRFGYRGNGGTGVGVRLLYNFVKKRLK